MKIGMKSVVLGVVGIEFLLILLLIFMLRVLLFLIMNLKYVLWFFEKIL